MRLPLVLVNDQEQELHFDGRPIGVDFQTVDLGHAALEARVAEVFAGTEPALLDVPIDPDVNAWTYPRFAAYERNGVPST